jgi:hypothetical protein
MIFDHSYACILYLSIDFVVLAFQFDDGNSGINWVLIVHIQYLQMDDLGMIQACLVIRVVSTS